VKIDAHFSFSSVIFGEKLTRFLVFSFSSVIFGEKAALFRFSAFQRWAEVGLKLVVVFSNLFPGLNAFSPV